MKEYRTERGVFYNGDCMAGMKDTPDKWYDCAIVDVPYGIGECGDKNKSRGKLAIAKDYKPFAGNDISAPDNNYFIELIRISKNQIIWGANHFISKIPYDSSCWIVWDKDNGECDFADCELAYTSFKSAVRKFKYKWSGMLQENMKNKEHRIHPTQKPVALYKWLVKNYVKQGDKILDTHVGSASSLIAYEDAGLEYVGYEKDNDYFLSAVKRMKDHLSQRTLFPKTID